MKKTSRPKKKTDRRKKKTEKKRLLGASPEKVSIKFVGMEDGHVVGGGKRSRGEKKEVDQ